MEPRGFDPVNNSKTSSITGVETRLHSRLARDLITMKTKISFTIQAKFKAEFLTCILFTQFLQNTVTDVRCLAIENSYSTFWW
jgi:hypothetical protein